MLPNAFSDEIDKGCRIYESMLARGCFRTISDAVRKMDVLAETNLVMSRTSKLSARERRYVALRYMYETANRGHSVMVAYSKRPVEEHDMQGPLIRLIGDHPYRLTTWADFKAEDLQEAACQVITTDGHYLTGWYWPSMGGIAGVSYHQIAKIRYAIPRTAEDVTPE
jgi:hypothetical protein